jgi:hypothetical protein
LVQFIIGLFTKKRKNMLTETEINSIENKLNLIRKKLSDKSIKSNNRVFIQSCKSMVRTIQTALDNLTDIKETQDEEITTIKKFNQH